MRLEAGKRSLDRRNRHPIRLFPHPSAEKLAAPTSAFAAASESATCAELRQVLKDPVAKDKFLSAGGTIETALKTLSPAPAKKAQGLIGDIDQLSESLLRYPWTTLASMKGDPNVLKKLDETENLIKELKKALTK